MCAVPPNKEEHNPLLRSKIHWLGFLGAVDGRMDGWLDGCVGRGRIAAMAVVDKVGVLGHPRIRGLSAPHS